MTNATQLLLAVIAAKLISNAVKKKQGNVYLKDHVWLDLSQTLTKYFYLT